MSKIANPDHPVHDLIVQRWSPYGFDESSLDASTLQALFEAARWAPSSYNEQPWRYIVATRDDKTGFNKLLACLVEPNQAWARHASVLALGVVAKQFERNGKDNRACVHDLGLASASLSFEATARGLFVHQMIGIDAAKAQADYAIPEGYEAYTALAIGRRADTESLSEDMAARDTGERSRKALAEFVFSGEFGQSAAWTTQK